MVRLLGRAVHEFDVTAPSYDDPTIGTFDEESIQAFSTHGQAAINLDKSRSLKDLVKSGVIPQSKAKLLLGMDPKLSLQSPLSPKAVHALKKKLKLFLQGDMSFDDGSVESLMAKMADPSYEYDDREEDTNHKLSFQVEDVSSLNTMSVSTASKSDKDIVELQEKFVSVLSRSLLSMPGEKDELYRNLAKQRMALKPTKQVEASVEKSRIQKVPERDDEIRNRQRDVMDVIFSHLTKGDDYDDDDEEEEILPSRNNSSQHHSMCTIQTKSSTGSRAQTPFFGSPIKFASAAAMSSSVAGSSIYTEDSGILASLPGKQKVKIPLSPRRSLPVQLKRTDVRTTSGNLKSLKHDQPAEDDDETRRSLKIKIDSEDDDTSGDPVSSSANQPATLPRMAESIPRTTEVARSQTPPNNHSAFWYQKRHRSRDVDNRVDSLLGGRTTGTIDARHTIKTANSIPSTILFSDDEAETMPPPTMRLPQNLSPLNIRRSSTPDKAAFTIPSPRSPSKLSLRIQSLTTAAAATTTTAKQKEQVAESTTPKETKRISAGWFGRSRRSRSVPNAKLPSLEQEPPITVKAGGTKMEEMMKKGAITAPTEDDGKGDGKAGSVTEKILAEENRVVSLANRTVGTHGTNGKSSVQKLDEETTMMLMSFSDSENSNEFTGSEDSSSSSSSSNSESSSDDSSSCGSSHPADDLEEDEASNLSEMLHAITKGARNASKVKLDEVMKLLEVSDNHQYDEFDNLAQMSTLSTVHYQVNEDPLNGTRVPSTLVGTVGETFVEVEATTRYLHLFQEQQESDDDNNDSSSRATKTKAPPSQTQARPPLSPRKPLRKARKAQPPIASPKERVPLSHKKRIFGLLKRS